MNTADQHQDLSPTKRAILELRELRVRLAAAEGARSEPIAIIGIGCRFPGRVDGPDAYWRLLSDGESAITEVPGDRWDLGVYYDPNPEAPGKTYARHGGFLEAVDRFDARFFGIAPREAASMDPQQRLLLEVAWEALEHAAQAPDALGGTPTGVYLGIANSDYGRLIWNDLERLDAYAASGSSFSVAAGRLSYLLGLRGPSVAVDTACSSSLVAVHLAVQALRGGECRLALAGGVNLILTPEAHVAFCRARMLAPDGRCKTFDARADGYVRGEGCGVVVLKRLSEALAEGDRVLAVIRGSAVNQDGRSSGLTVPNGPAQEAVIRAALENARLDAAAVDYVEAHGTGTALGDPIEIQALAAALGVARPTNRPLLTGSVKTNIGHLEAAAGMAGLIKAVLALQHGTIPASLHFETPNPHVPWTKIPVQVVATPTPWPPADLPRVAGVSSFGFSGTNAHVVLEEAPAPTAAPAAATERPRHLILLSAASDSALRDLAIRWEQALDTHDPVTLSDVCRTAAVGRAHLGERLAVVTSGIGPARASLRAFARGSEAPGVVRGRVADAAGAEVAFLFTGQGAQYPGMGRELYDTEPTFRRTLDHCAQVLEPQLGRSLLSILYPEPATDERLDETRYTQPALFALEYALAALWRSWGVEPTLVLGHSVGELVAATVAGVFNLDDALRFVATRARLMQGLPAGAMATVWAPETRVAPLVARHADSLALAAVNGPEHVVVSGDAKVLDRVLGILNAEGVRVRRLRVSRAFHSPAVERILTELEREAARIERRPPGIGLVSNVSGDLAGSEVTTAEYWRQHARAPVRFADGMLALWRQGMRLFVEAGPSPTLVEMASACVPTGEGTWMPSLRPGRSNWETLLEAAGNLYVNGVALDRAAVAAGPGRRRLSMPTYPFQRSRYWIDMGLVAATSQASWEDVVEAGAGQSEQAPLDLGASGYTEKWACLEKFTTAAIAAAMADLGVFSQAGEAHTSGALADATGIQPGYRRLLERWLDRLVAEGLLVREGSRYLSPRPVSRSWLEPARRDVERALADLGPLLEYVDRCAAQLAAVVTGRVSALDTLFPGGSLQTTDFIYREWAVSRYSTGIARAVVEAWVRTRPAGARVTAVEVGAGTGSLTSAVLSALPARTAYWYTDVSRFFFPQAERRFGTSRGVRYGLLDIDRDPLEQGYGAHAFDLVVAGNVLHATRDVERTVDHLRALLAPGGLLLILETTLDLAFLDITTGLVEGWQVFSDSWRRDSPLLTADRWIDLLRARGFTEVAAFPGPSSAAAVLGQHVLAARAPQAAVSERVEVAPVANPEASAGAVSPAIEGPPAEEFRRQLDEAVPAEREELLVDFVRRHVAHVLRLDTDHPLDARHRLMDLGIDSLMAVELRTRLTLGLGLPRTLPATLVFDFPTMGSIASFLGRELVAAPATETIGPAPALPPGVAAARLAELSEEAAEELLLKKLEELR